MQFGSLGSMHCASFTPASSRYHCGKWSPGSSALETAATPPVPVPVTATWSGEPLLLEVISSETGWSPASIGRNWTPMAQLAPGSTEEPLAQPSEAMRYWLMAALSPTRRTSWTCSGAVPLLVTVTVRVGLIVRTRTPAKSSEAGLSDTSGASPCWMPLPVSATRTGERTPPVLETASVAGWRPACDGVKRTPTLQVSSRLSVVPTQAPSGVYCAAFGPLMSIPLTVTGDESTLVTVTCLSADVVPTAWPPKSAG